HPLRGGVRHRGAGPEGVHGQPRRGPRRLPGPVNPRWALLVALLTLTACAAHPRAGGPGSGGSPTGGSGAASAGAVRDEPSYRLSIQVSPPRPGHAEPATLGLTLTAHQDLTLSFATGQRFDFMAFRHGNAA